MTELGRPLSRQVDGDILAKIFSHAVSRHWTPGDALSTTLRNGDILALLRGQIHIPSSCCSGPEELAMPTQTDNILRINAVLDCTGLSRSTLYRKLADASFPPPERLNPRCIGWRESRVQHWIMNPHGYRAGNDNDAPVGRGDHGEG